MKGDQQGTLDRFVELGHQLLGSIPSDPLSVRAAVALLLTQLPMEVKK